MFSKHGINALKKVSTTALRKVLVTLGQLVHLADAADRVFHRKEKRVLIYRCMDLGIFQGQDQSPHSVTIGSTTGFKN